MPPVLGIPIAPVVARSGSYNADTISKAPPLVARRHSVAQTDHEHLQHEDPAFFNHLMTLFEEKNITHRPDSPPLVTRNACSFETLEESVLDKMFGDSKKHMRVELPPTPRMVRSKTQTDVSNTAKPTVTSTGPGQWLAALAKRKVGAKKPDGQVAPVVEMPEELPPKPKGWKPAITTVTAMLRLTRLQREHKDPEAAAAAAEKLTDDDLQHVPVEDLSALQSIDDSAAFIEQCYIAEMSDPRKHAEFQHALLDGAYNDPQPDPSAFEAAPPYGVSSFEVMDHSMQQMQLSVQPPMSPYAPLSPQMAPTYAPNPEQYNVEQYGAQQMYHGYPPEAQLSYPQAMAPTPHQHMSHHHPMYQQQMTPMPYAQLAQRQLEWGWGAMGPAMQAQPMPTPQMAPMPPMAMAPAMGLPLGRLVGMAMEQEGSRILQQQLQLVPPAQLAPAVEELAPHLASLATNAFGNYLVSTLAGLPTAHMAVHAALTGQVAFLMQHPQGSRVCQAAFERLAAPLSHALVNELHGHVADVANGTHGSWSVVAAYKHTRQPFILQELAGDIGRLSTMQNGSRVVQRVLLAAAENGEDVTGPIEALLGLGNARLAALAQDRFGNYVVQIALRHATSHQQTKRLLDALLPHFHALALGKCSSNVAEVLVERSSSAQLTAVRAALAPGEEDSLRTHAFGTYVMNALDGRENRRVASAGA